jgi:hypothetical protein
VTSEFISEVRNRDWVPPKREDFWKCEMERKIKDGEYEVKEKTKGERQTLAY